MLGLMAKNRPSSSDRPPHQDANEAPDGESRPAPQRLDEWRLERVAFDSPGAVERMSDAPPALISILAAMVGEVIEYERQEAATDGT